MDQLVLKALKNRQVNLCDKQIGDAGIDFIRMQQCKKIKKLIVCSNLSIQGWNNISAEGLLYFCQAQWTNLLLLNLYQNKIGSRGCKYLSKTTLNKIKEIQLGSNPIGSAGVLHLSKASWKTLQYLYLENNSIAVEGVRWLNAAKSNNIAIISIGVNNLPVQQVYNLLQTQHRLLYVFFRNNLMNQQDESILKELLKLKFEKITF